MQYIFYFSATFQMSWSIRVIRERAHVCGSGFTYRMLMSEIVYVHIYAFAFAIACGSECLYVGVFDFFSACAEVVGVVWVSEWVSEWWCVSLRVSILAWVNVKCECMCFYFLIVPIVVCVRVFLYIDDEF